MKKQTRFFSVSFIRLRFNTPQLAAGIKSGESAEALAKADKQLRRMNRILNSCDTSQLAARRFII